MSYKKGTNYFPVVDNLNFSIHKGKVTAIIGESGGGKTQTGLAMAGLLPKTAKFKLESNPPLKNYIISFIFQDPLNALNPLMKIGSQIKEAIRNKSNSSFKKQLVLDLLDKLEISDSLKRYKQYPYELSGGMRQRILIAMALARDSDILIADEPATSLDVRIKYQIIEMLKKICLESEKTIIYITHDLDSVKGFADYITIMYAGKIVEWGRAESIYHNPKHPYTKNLIKLSQQYKTSDGRLEYIKGQPPLPDNFPEGCRFHPRCEVAIENCKLDDPKIKGTTEHWWKCPLYD